MRGPDGAAALAPEYRSAVMAGVGISAMCFGVNLLFPVLMNVMRAFEWHRTALLYRNVAFYCLMASSILVTFFLFFWFPIFGSLLIYGNLASGPVQGFVLASIIFGMLLFFTQATQLVLYVWKLRAKKNKV
jgi:hypothetical protein